MESSPQRPHRQDPPPSISFQVSELVSQMSLAEKIGQMTLVEKNSIRPEEVARHFIGAVLSGGGASPETNTPAEWLKLVNSLIQASLETPLGIPILYGQDAVHGHNNVYGATIFPHNIGLGAARDSSLVARIAQATALEMAATGTRWNYAPTIAVPQDLRWGRVLEGFSEETDIVSELGSAYIRGLQGGDLIKSSSVLATPKHYLGDGGTGWGSSTMIFQPFPAIGIDEPTPFMIDQGDTVLDESTLRSIHLAPYIAAVEAGALVIMASFSSWNGEKMHSHYYLLTEVLKGELGFSGFIVSDWGGIDAVSADYYQTVVASINAGIDMVMVPMDYMRFISNMHHAVDRGAITMARIDDAVGRILTVKGLAGLFEHLVTDEGHFSVIGSREHRALAREAVARSLVVLKNEGKTLPLSKTTPSILVAGKWANDIGLQCGGWTIEWLGSSGAITPGTTILEAVEAAVSGKSEVRFDPDGKFDALTNQKCNQPVAEVGIIVLGEYPYAEGFGDQPDLTLTSSAVSLIKRMRGLCKKVVLILISGRPLIVTDQLPLVDAFVAAWLPGTEGAGVADVLFGDLPFTGKLPYTWPRAMDQIPLDKAAIEKGIVKPLYPFGFGLS